MCRPCVGRGASEAAHVSHKHAARPEEPTPRLRSSARWDMRVRGESQVALQRARIESVGHEPAVPLPHTSVDIAGTAR